MVLYEQYTDMSADAHQGVLTLEAVDEDVPRLVLPIQEFNRTMTEEEFGLVQEKTKAGTSRQGRRTAISRKK